MSEFTATPIRLVPGHARDPITGKRLSDFAAFVDKVTAIDLAYDPAFDPFAIDPLNRDPLHAANLGLEQSPFEIGNNDGR